MTPAPLQVGQAPSELALNSAGFTPLAFANALRIGSSSPVYVAGLLRREPLIAAWSTDTTPSRPDTEPWISELLPEPATPGDHDQHAERDVDVDVLQVVGAGAAHLQHPRRCPDRRLQGGPVVQVPPGERAAGPQPVDRALEDHLPTAGARAGAEVDDVVGDRDRLRLVLHDEHRVALVAQLQQQVVHPLDVMGVQADGRLVEDVGDVGQRRPEVPDHLGALRLAARERAGRAVEAEVSEPDLHERVEVLPQRRQQRRHRRLVEAADPLGQVADLHRAHFGDVDPLDLRRPGRLAEPRPAAVGAGGERHRSLDERADVRLQRVDVLGEERLLDLRDQTLVGQVDPRDLHLGRLL